MKRFYRSEGTALAALCAFFAVCQCVSAKCLPLEFDEFFTFYVARQRSFGTIYNALLHGADNHPVLNYWIVHTSFDLFGASEFTLRLASILAAVLSLVCTFYFLRRISGTMAAFAALGVVILSRISQLAHVGRSFSVMFLWSAAALLCWQNVALGRRRKLSLALLAALFLTASWLDYYAVFHLAAVAVAETARTIRRRKLDWPIWCAMACSLLGLPVVLPLLPIATVYTAHFWSPVNVQLAMEFYEELFSYGIPAAFGALIVWNCLRPAQPEKVAEDSGGETAAGIYLLLLPSIIFLAALYTHALQSKYAITMPLGAAILINRAAATSPRFRQAVLLSYYGLALVLLPMQTMAAFRTPKIGLRLTEIYRLARQTSLPIVIDNSHTFLPAAFYAPDWVAGRLVYLANPIAAFKIYGKNTDEYALHGLAAVAPLRVIQEEDFLREQSRFLLLHDGGWLLPDLLNRFKATVQLLTTEEAGEVLEIKTTLAPQSADRNPATH